MRRAAGDLRALFGAAVVALACRSGHAEAEREPGTQPVPVAAPASIWSSPEACEAALRRGRTRARARGTAAIASWNVRWFPDGAPFGSRARTATPTNVEWLACALAWLAVDVVALQEIQAHPGAVDAMARVVARLDQRTHGRWRLGLDGCDGASFQHVGLLWNTRRVSAGTLHAIGALNPRGAPCAGWLRPGFGGRFRFRGGLDLHVVSVHLKSGDEQPDRALRERSLAGLGAAHRVLQQLEPEDDVLIAGDFNTQGCPRCSPALDGAAEIAGLEATLRSASPPFRRLAEGAAGCSYYRRGRAAALDHFVATAAMREAGSGAHVSVQGVCGDRACGPIPRRAPARALSELSDHCPIVLELPDRDLD